MNVKIYPYKMASASAKVLKTTLIERGVIAHRIGPDWNRRLDNIVVNWGNSIEPDWEWQAHDLNHPSSVLAAINKLETFNILSNVNINVPEYTSSRLRANDWISEGTLVVGRGSLKGHSGEGIILLSNEVHEALHLPLYVKYKKKRSEYRVHVFRDTVIDIQEKRKERGFDRNELQARIRSHENGWVFCRDDLNIPDSLEQIAKDSINALGLDFGAVDIIYNERENKCYVLEVNTAVGMEGETAQIYGYTIATYAQSI